MQPHPDQPLFFPLLFFLSFPHLFLCPGQGGPQKRSQKGWTVRGRAGRTVIGLKPSLLRWYRYRRRGLAVVLPGEMGRPGGVCCWCRPSLLRWYSWCAMCGIGGRSQARFAQEHCRRMPAAVGHIPRWVPAGAKDRAQNGMGSVPCRSPHQ